MEPDRQRKHATRLAIVSAAVVVLCVAVLVGQYVLARIEAAEDRRVVDAYVEQVKSDPDAAAPLHEERDRQTMASIAREETGNVVAWVLLAAASLLVVAGKWSASTRPLPSPSLDALVADRFAQPAGRAARPPAARPEPDRPEGQALDLAVVDDLIERNGTGREAAIPILQGIQSHYRYLPDEALARVCERTEITAAQIAGTSSFYAQFRRSPVGRHVVRVCHGTACHVAGAEQITEELRRHLGIEADADTDPHRRFTIDAVACVGCCSLAPVLMIEDETVGRLTPSSARRALDAVEPPE